jgi:hypothetical protein
MPISKSIETISNVSNESASGIQHVAKSPEDLNELTGNLKNLISNCKIDSNERTKNYSVRHNGKLIES